MALKILKTSKKEEILKIPRKNTKLLLGDFNAQLRGGVAPLLERFTGKLLTESLKSKIKRKSRPSNNWVGNYEKKNILWSHCDYGPINIK